MSAFHFFYDLRGSIAYICFVFTSAEEVDLSSDVQQWDSLSDSEKHFITHVLAFFAASDGIVLENLAARFLNDVKVAEVTNFTYLSLCISFTK